MIEDGHFKELKLILDFVYTKRVEYKKQSLSHFKVKDDLVLLDDAALTKRALKEKVIKQAAAGGASTKKDFVVKEIEKNKSSSSIDLSKVVDLYDEEGMFEEIRPENLIIEAEEEKERVGKSKKTKKERVEEEKRAEREAVEFAKEYKKMGGI